MPPSNLSIAIAGQKAARTMLEDLVRQELRRGSPSMTIELTGYLLSGRARRESYYDPQPPETRRLAAPEFLSGFLTDRIG